MNRDPRHISVPDLVGDRHRYKPMYGPDGWAEGLSDAAVAVEIQARRGTFADTGLTVIDAGAVKPRSVEWLWPGWIARGKIHLLAGAPGTGKTSAALALAATLSVGGRWPDGSRADPGHALVWSGEDDAADTLVPRLMACGAELTRVHFVLGALDADGPRAFDPSKDIALLVDHMATMDPAPTLLLVDPIVSAVAGDSHKNAEVRRSLQPLVDLAGTRNCAVLGITHFSKGSAGRDPMERMTGSLAFGALVRIGMVAAKLPDTDGGGRILARAKSNIGPDGCGFAYDLEVCEPVAGIETTRVLWGKPLEGSARDILAQAESVEDPEERGALSDAVGFLKAVLADGPMTAKAIQKEGGEAGLAWATVRRAKDVLAIEPRKEGFQGKWKWALPKVLKDAHKGAHPKNMSTFGTDEHLWAESRTYEGPDTPKVLKESKDAHPRGVGTFGEHDGLSEDRRSDEEESSQ